MTDRTGYAEVPIAQLRRNMLALDSGSLPAGALLQQIGTPNNRTLWLVERIGVKTSDGSSATFQVLIQTPGSAVLDALNIADAAGPAPAGGFSFEPRLHVADNETLYVYAAGFTAGANVGISVFGLIAVSVTAPFDPDHIRLAPLATSPEGPA
jgi:hypothetical protein